MNFKINKFIIENTQIHKKKFILINYHPSFYFIQLLPLLIRIVGRSPVVEPVSPLSPFLTLKSIEETSIQVDVGESSRVVWPAVLASGSVSSLKSRLIIIKVVEDIKE